MKLFILPNYLTGVYVNDIFVQENVTFLPISRNKYFFNIGYFYRFQM